MGSRMAHQTRSAKNILANSLPHKALILRENLNSIFHWDLGGTRSADVEPILYCTANSLISKDSACANPCPMNYPGFCNGPSGVKPLE